MIATGTTLGCGMSICIALWTADARAIENELPPAKTYEFAEGTVIVQPGPASPSRKGRPAPSTNTLDEPHRIQLAHLAQLPPAPFPADEVAVDASAHDSVAHAEHHTDEAAAPVTSDELLHRLQRYREVYNSIPFSRAEYDANPSYRHDATMEFLFGQMRPTVVHRQPLTNINVNVGGPAYGYGSGLYFNRYGLHNRWSPFMYPPYRW